MKLRDDEPRQPLRPSSAPALRRKENSKRIFNYQDDFNPIFFNKRYPGNTDKQIGRWTSESHAKYTWRKPTSPMTAFHKLTI